MNTSGWKNFCRIFYFKIVYCTNTLSEIVLEPVVHSTVYFGHPVDEPTSPKVNSALYIFDSCAHFGCIFCML